jgi:hypothetical protein
MVGSSVTLDGVPTMRAPVTTPGTIRLPMAWPSIGWGRTLLLESAKQVLGFFASLRSGTDLVRDPFSAENSRD